MIPTQDPGHSCHTHAVHFYRDPVAMSAHVAAFLVEGLNREEAVIVIATPQTHEALQRQLSTNSSLPDEHRLYGAFDADATLSTFLVAGMPNRERFFTVMDQILGTPARSGRPIRVYGEMVVRLWEAGQPEGALHLEELWNLLAARHHFSLLCAYPMRTFANQDSQGFLKTCASHARISFGSDQGRAKTPCLV